VQPRAVARSSDAQSNSRRTFASQLRREAVIEWEGRQLDAAPGQLGIEGEAPPMPDALAKALASLLNDSETS
jgi:hypothetical protein